MRTINGYLDDLHWELLWERIDHPANETVRRADLVRCKDTGIYRLWCAGALVSCPQHWAQVCAMGKKVLTFGKSFVR